MKKTLLVVALLAAMYMPVNAQEMVKGTIENVASQGSYTPSFKNDGSTKKPLNIILMIGDGTGLSHIASGYYANGGELTLTNLKTCGWVTTQSADSYTTDSAASGTAYATGQKTHNYAIGVDINDNPLANIPEKAHAKGIVSGIISTDDLNGATPAAFFAHTNNRNNTKEIWAGMQYSPLSFFAAGSKEVMESQSEDTRKALKDNFTIVDNLSDPVAASSERLGYLPPKSETASLSKGRGDFLPATTSYAIDYLMARKTSRKKGFFLMVEAARIDKSAHGNDFPTVVKEVLDFDKAIEAAVRFAEKDGNTLVIITADHETGALTLGYDGDPSKGTVNGVFCSGSHTPSPVPLFAYGPHSQDFMGVQGNEEVSQKIQKLLGIE